MKPIVAFYVLSEKIRLSGTEANSLLFELEAALTGIDIAELLLHRSDQIEKIAIYISVPNNKVDSLEETLDKFIRDSPNGAMYVARSAEYEIKYAQCKYGQEKENTVMAIIYRNSTEQNFQSTIPIEVSEFIERGNRWEKLERSGDALCCYRIGLDMHPDDDSLKIALSKLMIKYDFFLPTAHKTLIELANKLPTDGAIARHLGECCLRIANTLSIEFKNITREDFLWNALNHLERAESLLPKDSSPDTDLQELRQRLNVKDNYQFFKK